MGSGRRSRTIKLRTALEVGAKRGKNIALIGEPGCGKSMMFEPFDEIFTVMGKRELLPLAIEWFRSASSRHQASTPCVHGRLLD